MQQRYPCPRCGVPVDYGCRFCGNCGNTINWGAPPPYPPPPPQQPPYGYPNQQQWGQQQQPGWNQPPPYNQPPRQGNPPQFPQQNTFGGQANVSQKKSSSGMLIFLVILIVIVFTIGGFAVATNGFSSTNKPTTSTPPVATETPPVTTPPTSNNTTQGTTPPPASNLPTSQFTQITADELIAAYSGDITGAKAKYEGNRYSISGKVSAVNSSAPPFIYFKGSQESPYEIQFSFSQGQESNVSDRNIGDSINIEGKVVNYLGTIIIVDDCKFVK